jgi:hypothetical protein
MTMRANIPTDNDFSPTLPPEDDSAKQSVSKEQLELAKIGNSPDWQIIKKYIQARVDVYKNGLFGEDLTGKSTDVIGQRFLAAQSVIQEFESLENEIETTTQIVKDVLKNEPTV